MNIYNRENIITNKQLNKFLNFVRPNVLPNKVYILENRIDLLRYFRIISHINNEGWCNRYLNVIGIKLYNLPKGKINKQLYGLGVLLHELKHLEGELDEDICDTYAKKFLNNNSNKVAEIMNWKEDYKVVEF